MYPKPGPSMPSDAPTLGLNDSNLQLVIRLREAALKSAGDFSITSFFADPVYADACLLAFEAYGVSELASLATQVRDASCQPQDDPEERSA